MSNSWQTCDLDKQVCRPCRVAHMFCFFRMQCHEVLERDYKLWKPFMSRQAQMVIRAYTHRYSNMYSAYLGDGQYPESALARLHGRSPVSRDSNSRLTWISWTSRTGDSANKVAWTCKM